MNDTEERGINIFSEENEPEQNSQSNPPIHEEKNAEPVVLEEKPLNIDTSQQKIKVPSKEEVSSPKNLSPIKNESPKKEYSPKKEDPSDEIPLHEYEAHTQPPYYVTDHNNRDELARGSWLWKDMIIPYRLDEELRSSKNSKICGKIMTALKLFQDTPIRFLDISTSMPRTQHVHIQLSEKSSTKFGCFDICNGIQELHISKTDYSVKTIAQLIMNVLGISTAESPISNYRPCADFYFFKDSDSIMGSGQTLSKGDLAAIDYLYGTPSCTRHSFGNEAIKQYLYLTSAKGDTNQSPVKRLMCIWCNYHHGKSEPHPYNVDLKDDVVCECQCTQKPNIYNSEINSVLRSLKRKFTLKKSVWEFQRVQYKVSKNFKIVYEAQRKNTKPDPPQDPLTMNSLGSQVDELEHSMVIRLVKLSGNSTKLKSLITQFETRLNISYDECPYLLKFYEDGMLYYADQYYYAVRYDNPGRDLQSWLTYDHVGLPIEVLDLYRLARSSLEAFAYLEKNGFILNEYSRTNIYVGNMLEDRGAFFKIMFKGMKRDSDDDKGRIMEELNDLEFFEDVEYESAKAYDYYMFKLGFFICYIIDQTKNKVNVPDSFLEKAPYRASKEKLNIMITRSMDLMEMVEPNIFQLKLKEFLMEILLADKGSRPKAEKLLGHDFIRICDNLDYEEFLKEKKELEEGKQRELDEERKVQDELAAMK